VFTALAGAVGALYGPLHGGANEVYSDALYMYLNAQLSL
jgi:citrate synthase